MLYTHDLNLSVSLHILRRKNSKKSCLWRGNFILMYCLTFDQKFPKLNTPNFMVSLFAYFIQNWESYIMHKGWKVLFVALTNNNWHVFEKQFATSFTIWHVFSAFWRSHSVMEWELLRKSCLDSFFQNRFLGAMG